MSWEWGQDWCRSPVTPLGCGFRTLMAEILPAQDLALLGNWGWRGRWGTGRCGCLQSRTQFLVRRLAPSEAFSMPSLRDGPPGPALREITSLGEKGGPERQAGEGLAASGALPGSLRCAWILPQFPQPWGKIAVHTDPFILPASWLRQKSRKPGNGNEELLRVTLCSAGLGAQPTLLTVYEACYGCSAILPSAQL